MKLSRIMLITLALSSIAVLSLSCASGSASSPEGRLVTVQRGDLRIDITGVGNLALSDKVDLAFEMPGTVEEVLVEEGDSVEKGQVLAKLDTSAWEDQVTALEDKVIAAERNVTAKKRAVTTAKRQIAAKELAQLKAQMNLQTAEDNLNKVAEVKKVRDTIDAAEYALKLAKSMLEGEFGGAVALVDSNYWSQLKALAEGQLAEAKRELQEILAGTSIKVTSDVLLEVAMKKLEMEQAQWGLEDAKIAIGDAKEAVGDAEKAVEDAQKALEDAQKALDEAKALSPTITAPFAGFITRVNVKGGDEVKKGTVAAVIADPNKFEADILVNEMDIPKVKLGGNATVRVDAMSGLNLPAKVTRISPSATIQSGVVNYKVKVEVQSLQAVMTERQPATGSASSDNVSAGRQPAGVSRPSDNMSSDASGRRFGAAFGSGNMTQAQIDQMRQQRQQALAGQSDSQQTQRQQSQAGQSGGQPAQMSTMMTGDLQLREGLTVTVSLVVAQTSNVLLVPNGAVTQRGAKSYVKVSKESLTEDREIKTGLRNQQYTEVTEGLSEDEKVVIPQATTSTSSSQQGRPPGGFMIPGVGGMR